MNCDDRYSRQRQAKLKNTLPYQTAYSNKQNNTLSTFAFLKEKYYKWSWPVFAGLEDNPSENSAEDSSMSPPIPAATAALNLARFVLKKE